MEQTTIDTTPRYDIFGENFWKKDFPQKTQNGIVPYLFEDVLPPHFAGWQAVVEAFQAFQDPKLRGTVVSHARIYIDEDRHDEFMQKALDEPFLSGETLCEFVQRIANAERFSLVINNLEQICPPLAADIGAFLKAMFSVRGAPIGGCEQVVFAGNYSGTAFGVHEGYEHAFLIHLGPGTKEFYCWSQEKYLELTKGNREPTYGDYTWMLEHGQKYILEPGNILYLPALVYHVGKQSDFSVSVAVPLYTFPKERYFTRVIAPGLSSLLPFDLEGMSEHIPLQDGVNNALKEYLPVAESIFSDYMHKELALIMAYRWNRLVSNGFWEISENYVTSPLEEFGLDANAMQLHKGNRLHLIPPYKVCWEKALNCSSDELRVFIRASSVVVPYKEELKCLLEKLNLGDVILLTEDWQVSFFNVLSQTGGLQKE